MMGLNDLPRRFPALSSCIPDIERAFEILRETFEEGKRVYVCGNGGSEADARHIVGELMKGFENKRRVQLSPEVVGRLSPETRLLFEEKLQGALPCHALSGETSLTTAICNDTDPALVYAQQIYGYGRPGDALIAISTSGNARNVCAAAEMALALDLRVVALTGRMGGILASLCAVSIRVPADRVADIQELHLPVYHAICRALEEYFFGTEKGVALL